MFDLLIRRVVRGLSPPKADELVHGILRGIERQAADTTHLGPFLETLDGARDGLYSCFREHTRSAVAAQALTLKVLNLCLAKHQFLRRSVHLVARPFGIEVDPANGCNLACSGCVHSATAKGLFDWKPGMLSEERLSTLLKELGPFGIQTLFCNYGEPLLNPLTPKFIRLAKSYFMQTVISTNLAMPRFDADAYVRSGLDYMILSIDGATQPVYERYRKKGNIDIVYTNIEKLVKAKGQWGKRTPILCWQYLAFEHNAHEIRIAIDIARSLGIDEFKLVSPFDVGWDDPGVQAARIEPAKFEFHPDSERSLAENWNTVPDVTEADTIERAFEAGWSGRKLPLEPDRSGGSPHTCSWLYKNMVMDANGIILPCCGSSTQSRDLQFGTFPSDTGDPFNSVKYQLARLSFANKDAYENKKPEAEPHCVNCTWDQEKTDVGNAHVEQYLRSAGSDLFNAESLETLCSW